MATMDIAKENVLYGSDFSDLAASVKLPQMIDYVDDDGKLVLNSQPRAVMVTSQSDLADLPQIYTPGSIAFVADETEKWRLGADGNWEELNPSE